MDIYHIGVENNFLIRNSLFDLKEDVAKYYCLGIYTIWLLAKSNIITSVVKFDK